MDEKTGKCQSGASLSLLSQATYTNSSVYSFHRLFPPHLYITFMIDYW